MKETISPPASIPAYQPFPLDCLPRPLAAYVREGAAALGCDPAMVALPALAVVGSLIGNTRTLRLKDCWREPCVFWTVIVSDSGTLKSPAMDLTVRPLHRLQKRLRIEHAAKFKEYQAVHEQWKARKAKDATNAGPEPEKPISPRIVCNDTTIERLGELLSENPRGILCARDELAGWFASFARYKGGTGGSDLPQWLEMHRAGAVTIDRKTAEKKSLFIDRAAVSVCGTIQPSILTKHIKGDFLDSGLVARLLLAMPPKARKVWRETDLAPQTADAFEQLLEALYRLDFGRDRHGEPVPIALKLDDDAHRTWTVFYDEWASEQADAEGERAAALSKLEAYAARFALLHHVIERIGVGLDDRVPIAVESVEAGIALARWFAHEAERVYSTFGESDEQRETRRLSEFIQSHDGSITARDLQRSNNRKYPNVAAAECALDALASAGLGEWTTLTPPAGGRPSNVFRLHGGSGFVQPPSPKPETEPSPPAIPPTAPLQPVAEPPPFSSSTVDENGNYDPNSNHYR